MKCLFHDWRKLSKQSPPQGLNKLIPVLFQNGFDPQDVVNRRLKVFSYANELCIKESIIGQKETKNYEQARYKVGDLLIENHIRLCSP